MKLKLTLRTRLILAFVLLSAIIAMTMAVIAHTVMEMSEQNLIEKILLREAEVLGQYFLESPDHLPPSEQYFRLYVVGPDRKDQLLAEVSEFKNKMGEIVVNKIEYELIRIDKEPYSFYFLYDFSQFEIFEYSVVLVLLISVFLSIVISLWIGMLASSSVIKPVSRLAESLEQNPDGAGIASIPGGFADDEVGKLARKFSEYNERLRAYIEREKAFTSNASHELRTPISVIAGAAEVLEKSSSLTNEDRITVMRIRREAEVMRELINLLLALARGEQSSKNDDRIDVSSVIAGQLDGFRELCFAKGIEFSYIENARPGIQGSSRALETILRNLLNNALQYTASGMITITADKDSISIEDTGSGIPDAVRDQVFHRFFRGGRKANARNMGVGLALVKELCEISRWHIDINQVAEHKGTRVTLWFSKNQQ